MPFSTYRDSWGIPHLKADTELELVYAQGYNAALDRGWQLEVERQRAKGTSAALLGHAHVEWDKFARRAKIDETARICYQNLPSATRQWVRTYVKGINAAVGLCTASVFDELGVAAQPWEPWTPISIWFSNHILMGGFASKLWREEVIQRMGKDYLAIFSSEGLWNANSNGWYIPGNQTESGMSLLAGDPHRVIELPSCYQQIHLSCDQFDVIGFAIPGIPGIAHFGHTGSVAWSITNAMANYQDLYFEKITQKGDEYFCEGPTGLEPVSVTSETIEVRDSEQVDILVMETERGPIIVDGVGQSPAISLRLPSRAFFISGFETLQKLLHAKSTEDVESAFESWVEPVNVLQTSDQQGNFRHKVVGYVPQRSTDNFDRIVPAWKISTAWDGRLSGNSTNHPDQVAVMANQRGLAADLGTEFSPPHRANRIQEMANAKNNWSAKNMEAIHTDTHLSTANIIIDRLKELQNLDEPSQSLLNQLIDWDEQMRADSTEAALFAKLRALIVNKIAAHPALDKLTSIIEDSRYSAVFAPWLNLTSRAAFALESILINGLPGVDLNGILRDALLELSQQSDLDTSWGELHTITPWTSLPGDDLKIWPGIGGDHDCVLSSYSLPGITHSCWRAPVARYSWDLSGKENSFWVSQFGASGDPASKHFSDQYEIWRKGELIPVMTDWNQLILDESRSIELPNVTQQRQTIEGLGNVAIDLLIPEKDIDLIHRWVTQESAKFWGMTEYEKQDVELVYEYIDAQRHQHTYLLKLNEEPIAFFQLYEPEKEEIGTQYEVREGDIGLHVFIAPTKQRVKNFTYHVLHLIQAFIFSDPGVQRIVGEPDAQNNKMLNRLQRHEVEIGKQIELSTKQAQLIFFTRAESQKHAQVSYT